MNEKFCFYSNRIRTLVAVATYHSHRHIIWEKRKFDNFFLSHWGNLDFFFTEMFIMLSSTFHTTFVQIREFDWLSARQKGSIFVKMFKNLLLRNHKGDMKLKLGINA